MKNKNMILEGFFSILEGFFSILNISGGRNASKKTQRKKYNLTDIEQDWQQIEQDWQQVGTDFRDAMNNFKRIIDR